MIITTTLLLRRFLIYLPSIPCTVLKRRGATRVNTVFIGTKELLLGSMSSNKSSFWSCCRSNREPLRCLEEEVSFSVSWVIKPCDANSTNALIPKKRRRSNVVEKFREVSDSVWVSFDAVIIEKTIKEEWTNKNNFNDNYNLVYSDTIYYIFNFSILTIITI